MIEKSERSGKNSNPTAQGAALVVIAGPRFRETFFLNEGENIVGSDPGVHFYFQTSLLSERHVLLTYRNREVVLKRLGGVTSVNNAPVEEAALRDGDLISMGGLLLRYVAEGSSAYFYVGDHFYRREKRNYARFSMIAAADAFSVVTDKWLEILSVRSVSRGGIGIFSKDTVPIGSEILVSLYSKSPHRTVVAEATKGTVVSVISWTESLFLLNVRFKQPISSEHQPNLYRHLHELEQFFPTEDGSTG